MPIPRDALRLDPEDLEELLRTERTMRIGTVGPDGTPHVAPMWYVWHDGAIWINSLRRSRRTRDLASGSEVAVCVDAGIEYWDLKGAVLYGRPVEATGDERLGAVQAEFARKYWGGTEMPAVKSHVWIRMVPKRIASWDFHKIPAEKDPRLKYGPKADGTAP
jgi:hypothetical protein